MTTSTSYQALAWRCPVDSIDGGCCLPERMIGIPAVNMTISENGLPSQAASFDDYITVEADEYFESDYPKYLEMMKTSKKPISVPKEKVDIIHAKLTEQEACKRQLNAINAELIKLSKEIFSEIKE